MYLYIYLYINIYIYIYIYILLVNIVLENKFGGILQRAALRGSADHSLKFYAQVSSHHWIAYLNHG
jgi:acyl-CoA thioesterase